MSEIDKATKRLNEAADKATLTTDFFDELTTAGKQSDVTNPNNNKTVPSVRKQVIQVYEGAGLNPDAISRQNQQLIRNLGEWQAGLTFENKGDYATFNDQAIITNEDTPLPYTTQGSDPTVAPDAGLVVPFAEVTRSDVTSVFNNLADLKAAPVVVGQSVRTLGYYDAGDGGGNDYKIVADGTGVDDGGSFIDLDNGLQAEGLFSNSVVSPEQFGARGDGITNDTVSFKGVTAIASGMTITHDGSKNYLIDELDLPDKSTIVTNGAVFTYSGAYSGSNKYVIRAVGGSYFNGDAIRVNVPSGIVHQRFVKIKASVVDIGRIEVDSVDQQAYGDELLDGAINISGSVVNLRSYKISNNDRALIINNADDVTVGAGEITSYRLGLWVEGCRRVEIHRPTIKVASPNATADPGNNGILMGDAVDLYLDKPVIEDSGEHGIRVGGGGGFDSLNITINRPRVMRPGRNGIKIRPNEANRARNVWILYPQVSDAGYGSTASGDNKNGILLQRCVNATVIEPRILKDSRAVSAVRGIECFHVDNIRIQGGFVDDPAENGIFATSVGVDDMGNTIYKDINTLSVTGGLRTKLAGQSSILVDFQNAEIRDLDLDIISTGSAAYGLEIRDDSGVGVIRQRGAARIRSDRDVSGPYGGSGFTPSKVLVDVVSSKIEGFIGADATTGNNLPPGVSATRVSTGVYDITHNLGLGDKSIVPSFLAYDTNVWPIILNNADTNVMRVKFQTKDGTVFDTDFFFEIRSNGRVY